MQTALFEDREIGEGAFTVLVGLQRSITGSYFPPVTKGPPQTIISLPVEIAMWLFLAVGAFVTLVGVQVFETGLYLPPVLR